jgi:hypothetical protein
MAIYNVSSKQLTDNYAVLQTLEPAPLEVGQSITVASVAAPFSGTFQIIALPEYEFIGVNSTTGFLEFNEFQPYPNQVLYAATGTNVERVQSFVGTITYTQTCTWITATDIQTWLGISVATAADQAFTTQCAAAANQFIYTRRQESGWFDSLTTAPSDAVKLGTIQYGGMLYRQRGAIDVFASFNEMGTAPVTGLSPIIKQLCGLDRPQIA